MGVPLFSCCLGTSCCSSVPLHRWSSLGKAVWGGEGPASHTSAGPRPHSHSELCPCSALASAILTEKKRRSFRWLSLPVSSPSFLPFFLTMFYYGDQAMPKLTLALNSGICLPLCLLSAGMKVHHHALPASSEFCPHVHHTGLSLLSPGTPESPTPEASGSREGMCACACVLVCVCDACVCACVCAHVCWGCTLSLSASLLASSMSQTRGPQACPTDSLDLSFLLP